VKQPGVLGLLTALNARQIGPEDIKIPGFSEGGLVEVGGRMLTLSQMIGYAMAVPVMPAPMAMPGFAEGGEVRPAAGGGPQRLDSSLTVSLDHGLILKALESPAGQRVVIRTLVNHRKAVRDIAT